MGLGMVVPVRAVLGVFHGGGIKCSVELYAVRPYCPYCAGCWVRTCVLVCLVCVPFLQDCALLVAFRKTLLVGVSKLLFAPRA